MGPHVTNIGAYAKDSGSVTVMGDAIGQVTPVPSPGRRAGRRRRADVGILTVLTEELRAVVGVLERHGDYRSRPMASGAQVHEADVSAGRSEEHTSEFQSRQYLVCRL